jgi:hypothetical protein
MSKQADHLSSYEIGIRRLLNGMGQNHPRYSEALVYQQRLEENIAKSRQYGETPTLNAGRAAIAHQLNELALSALGKSFSELCDQVMPIARRELTEWPMYINDPLSLAKLGANEPDDDTVRLLLDDLNRAWADGDWEEMEYLYHHILECNNPIGTGWAQLYLAHAQAQNNNLEQGIDFARRALTNFSIKCDDHLGMVTHLLLASLEQSSRNLSGVKQEYQKALGLCQRLQSEITQSKEKLPYDQIYEEIRHAQGDVGKAIHDLLIRRCFLRPVPILRLSDGPDAILEHSKTIDYVEAGVFKIGERRYYLYPLDETRGRTLKLKVGAVHFALHVPKDGWPHPVSKKDDYALMRQETQINREGPGASWTGEKWEVGHFKRDPTTGEIGFEPPQPYIIGMGCAIALFKPKLSIESIPQHR